MQYASCVYGNLNNYIINKEQPLSSKMIGKMLWSNYTRAKSARMGCGCISPGYTACVRTSACGLEDGACPFQFS